MITNKNTTRHTLAGNLKVLMDTKGWTQTQTATKSGVSQRTVSNMLDPDGPSPSLDKVEQIAAAFGLNGWHLIMPNLEEDLLNGSSITSKLLQSLESSSAEGRMHILRVAEREAEYNAIDPQKSA